VRTNIGQVMPEAICGQRLQTKKLKDYYMSNTQVNKPEINTEDWAWLGTVIDKVNSLQYGKVELTIQDGVATLIETTDRVNLDKKPIVKLGKNKLSALATADVTTPPKPVAGN
jgi:hypothetical protein